MPSAIPDVDAKQQQQSQAAQLLVQVEPTLIGDPLFQHQQHTGVDDHHQNDGSNDVGQHFDDGFQTKAHCDHSALFQTRDSKPDGYLAALADLAHDRFFVFLFGCLIGAAAIGYSVQSAIVDLDLSQICSTAPAVSGDH